MTVSDAVAARVRQVRKRRDWKPADLAARCAELGAGDLTESVIEDIESRSRRGGRKHPRPVTVDELLALAAALNVPAVSLLVDPDDDGRYSVTAGVSEPAWEVRGWIDGHMPLGDADPRRYYAETDRARYYETEFGRAALAHETAFRQRERDRQQREEGEGT